MKLGTFVGIVLGGIFVVFAGLWALTGGGPSHVAPTPQVQIIVQKPTATPGMIPVPTVEYTGQGIVEIVQVHAGGELVESVVESYVEIAEDNSDTIRDLATEEMRRREGWTTVKQVLCLVGMFAILGLIAAMLPDVRALLLLRASRGNSQEYKAPR